MTSTAEYMRKYRAENPERWDVHRARQRATSRALYRLANEYPEAFEKFANEERAKEGLPPLGDTPVGRPPRTRA